MGLFSELRRRNVFRVAIAYLVVAWLCLQVVDVVAPILALPDWLPRAVLLLLLVGLPIALVVAWAYELTPEGIKRESEVDRSQSATQKTGQRLNRLIIVALCLVIALLLVERTMFANREGSGVEDVAGSAAEIDRSVAVLPFADLSQAGDQEWFADGLAEEILNALARTPDLLVSARTSSFAYKGSDQPIPDIARELGVAHVLEGSVRRSGDRLRVTAQLIRASDGFHLWSENYDRASGDVIELQEELAISIARALHTTMDPAALEDMLKAGTRSVVAYELYLQGLALIQRVFSDSEFDKQQEAMAAFRQATVEDPRFSEAYAAEARQWQSAISISNRGLEHDLPSLPEMNELFRERILKAIETARQPLDRQRYEAQLALAEMRLRDVSRLLQSVFTERPNDSDLANDLASVAVFLSDQQLLDRISEHAWERWELDENWAMAYIQYTPRIRGQVPDRDLFVQRLLQITERYPTPGVAYQVHRALLWQGEVEAAARLVPQLKDNPEGGSIVVARQACAEGRRADAEATLMDPPEDYSEYFLASRNWHILMLLGRDAEAVATLRPFELAESPSTLGGYLTYPHFDPAPFPLLQEIIERERIDRPAPVPIPFGCKEAAANPKSVAVLPFDNLSSDPEQEYFADGLTEEILNALAQLPELMVTARTSTFYFKDHDLPVDEIGERLGVAHLLEGSVRRAGEQVRITAQLVRAADGFHLWSQTYDATMENVFQVQVDIATRVASALNVLLDDNERELMEQAGVRNPEAYTLFARGFELHRLGHSELPQIPALIEARPYFEQATALAPEMWAAYFTNADLQSHILLAEATGSLPDGTDGDLVKDAPMEHQRLLQLSARHAPNQAAKDYVDFTRGLFSGNWSGLGELAYRLHRSRDACGYDMWLHLLGAVYGDAMAIYEFQRRGARCTPTADYWSQIVYAAIYAGRPELALPAVEEGMLKAESTVFLEEAHVFALVAMGRHDEAEVLVARMNQPDDDALRAAAFLAASKGEVEHLGNLRRQAAASDNARHVFHPLHMAAWAGDQETANRLAAEIDGHPAGATALAVAVSFCFCGAPFDIDATPNFRDRIKEAGLQWPPQSPINWPLKTW